MDKVNGREIMPYAGLLEDLLIIRFTELDPMYDNETSEPSAVSAICEHM